jgi:hypothetical protein
MYAKDYLILFNKECIRQWINTQLLSKGKSFLKNIWKKHQEK